MKFISVYDVEERRSYIINTSQIVWFDINSYRLTMSAPKEEKELCFRLDKESIDKLLTILFEINKGDI